MFGSMRKPTRRRRPRRLVAMLTVTCALLASVALSGLPAQAADWTPWDGQFPGGVLRLDSAGNPYSVYVEPTSDPSTGRIWVDRWNAGSWAHVGPAVGTINPAASPPDLALDPAGNPIVAWDYQGAVVSRWNGTSWTVLGSPFLSIRGGYTRIVSTNPLRVSYLSSSPNGAPGPVVVMEWNGSAWTQLTSRPLLGYSFGFPFSVVADGNGNIDVAWQAYRGTGGVWGWDSIVEQFAGGTWSRLGGLLNVNPPDWGVTGAQLRASGGQLTVLFTESFYRQADRYYVKQWTGSSWVQLGGLLNPDPSVWRSLALDSNGTPTVAVTSAVTSSGAACAGNAQCVLQVKAWDGAGWQQVGGNLLRTDDGVTKAAVESGGGTLAVAWATYQSPTGYISHLDSGATPTPTPTSTPTPTPTPLRRPLRPTPTPTPTPRLHPPLHHPTPTPTPTPTNLVPNPGFESPGLPTNRWGSTLARSTALSHTGLYALAQTASSSSGGWDLDANSAWYAPVTSGKAYTATIWVRASRTVNVRPWVDLLSSTGRYLDSAGSARVSLPANTWTKLTVTFTPINGQTLAVFEPNFSSATTGTVLYWDDMSITAG